jgi:hypothetical protein
LANGIETIVTSNADASFVGHDDFATSKELLGDISDLITNGTDPGARIALKSRSEGGLTYWEVRL